MDYVARLTSCDTVVGGATSDDGRGSSLVECSVTPCINNISPASNEGTIATVVLKEAHSNC